MGFPLDQPVRLSFSTFSDATRQTPGDATTVTLTIQAPDGTTTDFTLAGSQIVHDSTGNYHYDYTPAAPGHYEYHWKSTGAVTTSQSGTFDVSAEFGTDLVSLADARDQLNITDTTHDDELLGFIDAATATVEGIVGPVLRRTYTEVHDGGGLTIVLNNPPIISVTSVTEMVGPTAYTLADAEINTTTGAYSYSIDSYERGVIARRWSGGLVGPFIGGVRNIQVVYVAGRSNIPPAIRLAALLLIEHLWEQTQRGSSTGRPVPGGSEPADVDYSPPSKESQAMSMLAPYRKAPALA